MCARDDVVLADIESAVHRVDLIEGLSAPVLIIFTEYSWDGNFQHISQPRSANIARISNYVHCHFDCKVTKNVINPVSRLQDL